MTTLENQDAPECIIGGCVSRNVVARGMCRKHYDEWRIENRAQQEAQAQRGAERRIEDEDALKARAAAAGESPEVARLRAENERLMAQVAAMQPGRKLTEEEEEMRLRPSQKFVPLEDGVRVEIVRAAPSGRPVALSADDLAGQQFGGMSQSYRVGDVAVVKSEHVAARLEKQGIARRAPHA